MDEFQFIESLDALLAHEAIDETTTAAVELVNTSISPVHGQGILSGPTGPGEIAEMTGTTWLGVNDNNRSISDPYTMTLQSNAGLTSVNTTQAVETAPFSQYSSAYVEQQAGTGSDSTQKMLGPLLLSALSPVPMSSPMLQAKIMTASNKTAFAPSGVMSVCSATSRGSSNASSSRRRGSSKSNNSTMSIGSVTSPGSKTTIAASRKRSLGETSMAVSDSEDDCSRRRHDRNLREQRRSQKITHQIDDLREVLASASVRFKPDKYSTLVSVVQYVKQLQLRSTMLDTEHKKLLDTITRTNEMVNEPYATSGTSAISSTGNIGSSRNCGIGTDTAKPDSALSGCVGGNDNANDVPNGGDVYNDDELVFARNVDYKCIFDRCGMPLAVASIDGRLMDCNHEFVKLTGYRREELLPNEKHQNQHVPQGLQRQGSTTIIADDVGSSFFSGSIFPDEAASSCGINDNSKKTKKELDATTTNAAGHTGHAEMRNFSLFNLLSRNNMEEVFMSLSEMLKQPPKDESGMSSVSKADYWSGNVGLSRNTHLEIRINVTLVRSPQGRAKFFYCSLTPLRPLPL